MHAKAMADYDEALRLEPNNASTYVYREIEWHRDMNYDRAIADYAKAIQLDRKYAVGYSARAETWRLKREYDKAVQDYTELVRVNPDHVTGHRALARLLSTCGDPNVRDGKRAVTEATRACELTGWKDCACLDTLAAAYAEAGILPAAVKWQNQAIERHSFRSEPALERGLGFKGRLERYERGQPVRE
jgi:tetratricopeptide (TPR) repeat protein